MEYRVMDLQHRPATSTERTGFRGTCIATIARTEKAGELAQTDSRAVLAVTLAIVGAAYQERLQYALTQADEATRQELAHFVAFDFQQIFHVTATDLPADRFAERVAATGGPAESVSGTRMSGPGQAAYRADPRQ